MTTNVCVKFTIEGLHKWPSASQYSGEVDFLENWHAHNFIVTCKREVRHDDRDVEILMFRREIMRWMLDRWNNKAYPGVCDFGASSCEMITKELIAAFDLVYCSVWEDEFVGAETYRT